MAHYVISSSYDGNISYLHHVPSVSRPARLIEIWRHAKDPRFSPTLYDNKATADAKRRAFIGLNARSKGYGRGVHFEVVLCEDVSRLP